MLKFCNSCKRDLETDNFYSFRNSTCKDCINRKIERDYCREKFDSTTLSKHIRQRHSTYDSSRTNDGTYGTSKTNDGTYNEKDHKAVIRFNSLKNDRTFDKKGIGKINTLLGKAKPLYHKREIASINQKVKIQFDSIIKKLIDLN